MVAPYAASAPARSRSPGNAFGQQRQRDGEQDRGADALDGTAELSISMLPARRRRGREREHDQAEGEDAPAAEPVRQRSGGEHALASASV